MATHCNTLQQTTTLYKTLQHSTTHCNTLQHTVTHCNTLQHSMCRGAYSRLTSSRGAINIDWNTMQHTCNTLQHTTAHCNILQHSMCENVYSRVTSAKEQGAMTATHCTTPCIHSNTLRHTIIHNNTLHHTSTLCNTLQHTAAHCNTLQRTVTQYVWGCSFKSHLIKRSKKHGLQHTATYLQYIATHRSAL